MELYFSHALDLSEDSVLSVQEITIANNFCNGSDVTELGLSAFVNMESFVVGDNCFANVEKCFLVGLHKLARVEIGKKSFVKAEYKTMDGVDMNRHFRLSDCENMRDLRIGCGSFLAYSVCEIDNLLRLESIQFGAQFGEFSGCFYWASIELRGGGVFCV